MYTIININPNKLISIVIKNIAEHMKEKTNHNKEYIVCRDSKTPINPKITPTIK